MPEAVLVILSDEQEGAIGTMTAALEAGDRVVTLAGAAGTGKTTIMRRLVEDLEGRGVQVVLCAPTGKAASRLSDLAGRRATTIHSILYRKHEIRDGKPVFLDPRSLSSSSVRRVLLVDEASMVGRPVYEHLLRACDRDMQILGSGDPHQLAPVSAPPGFDLEHPTARLDEIHRQALESPILRAATVVRGGGRMPMGKDGDYERRKGSVVEAGDWLVERLRAGKDAVVLALTNDVRIRLNRYVRRALGLSDDTPLGRGERVVVRLNNPKVGRFNGETLTVDDLLSDEQDEPGIVSFTSDGDVYSTIAERIGSPDVQSFRQATWAYEDSSRFLLLDRGYALTVWTSQASEWESVCLLVDQGAQARFRHHKTSQEEVNRIAYTAMTRAKRELLVLDC